MLRQATTAASEPISLPGLADPFQGQGRLPAGSESVVRHIETGLAIGLPVGVQKYIMQEMFQKPNIRQHDHITSRIINLFLSFEHFGRR